VIVTQPIADILSVILTAALAIPANKHLKAKSIGINILRVLLKGYGIKRC
jgi:hypothetical protein